MSVTFDKVLFITTVDLTIESGGTRYSKTVLNAFASKSKVKTLVLTNSQKHQDRRLRWFFAIAKSIFTGVPPNVLFHSGSLRADVKRLISEPWDVVVIDHMESGYAMHGSLVKRCLYVSHNRESQLVVQKVPAAPKLLINLLSAWVEHYEKKLVKSVSGTISISNVEADWYRLFSNHVEVVYPVFEVTAKRSNYIGDPGKLRLGFLGSAEWRPNAEGMDILIKDILPSTNRKIELFVAGGAWNTKKIFSHTSRANSRNDVSINVLGYVSDIQKFWSSIDVFVAPILGGAGINVKVCEAIANGVPVLAFSHAVRGLSSRIICSSRVHIVGTAKEFSEQLNQWPSFTVVDDLPSDFSSEFAIQAVSNLLNSSLRNR